MVLLIEPRKISLSIRKRDSVTLQTQILDVFSRRIASSHNQYVFVLDRVRSHVEEQSLFERRRQSIFLRFIRPAIETISIRPKFADMQGREVKELSHLP